MKNKKQFQLKTIEMGHLAEFVTMRNCKTIERQSLTKMISSPIKNSQVLLKEKFGKFKSRKINHLETESNNKSEKCSMQNFQINRKSFSSFCTTNSMSKKIKLECSNYKDFPVRHPTIRNNNPFKFFQSSAICKTTIQDILNENHFMDKLSQILSQAPSKRMVLTAYQPRKSLIQTPKLKTEEINQNSQNKQRIKTMSLSNHEFKRKAKQQPHLAPWGQADNQEETYFYTEL